MAIPTDVGIVDTFIGFPSADRSEVYKFLDPKLRDRESREDFKMPAQYMFKDVPDELEADDVDPVAVTLATMDAHGVDKGMCNIGKRAEAQRAVRDHPDRFLASIDVDPAQGMDAVRQIQAFHADYSLKAVTSFPAGVQVAINDKAYYPVYAKCAELGLPIFLTCGVPGPRVPMQPQDVAHLDEVCWFFPELTVVMRHGAQPWCELAVKLMLKWPNLYYSTSAFAPKHYPPEIIQFANTRGADKVMYAGYYPAGLTYERIMAELPHVGLNDDVWPKFLRGNALRVLGVEGG